MLDELGMDLIYEERFCDAYKRYIQDPENQSTMKRMRAAEAFSLKERSNSDYDQREYRQAAEFLEKEFKEKLGEQVVSMALYH
jgi:single-stranded DNA-binding protein